MRRDRETHAGGVCMYIRNDLAFNPRPDLQNENLEDLFVEILLPKTKPIILGTCYRVQENSNFLECFENSLNLINPEYETIILGDFNICLLKNTSKFRKEYIQLLNLFNL